MTDRIVVDDKTTDEITEAARLFQQVLHRLLAGAVEPDALHAFACSVGVQAILRAGVDGRDDTGAQAAFLNAAEGIGQVLGLIPDAGSRWALYVACAQSMNAGMQSQAMIHDTQGNG